MIPKRRAPLDHQILTTTGTLILHIFQFRSVVSPENLGQTDHMLHTWNDELLLSSTVSQQIFGAYLFSAIFGLAIFGLIFSCGQNFVLQGSI